MNNKFSPIYEIEVKAVFCSLELWVNDVLVFCHFEENGSVWVDWPVNQYILESGIQEYELKIFPYKNQKVLSNKMEIELGVHSRDATIDTTENRKDLIERNLIIIPKKDSLTYFSYKGIFTAEVPYVLKGWRDSVILKNEDTDTLLNELLIWNNNLLNIYQNSDSLEYREIYKLRTKEFDIAYYINKDLNEEINFNSKFKDLTMLSNKSYRLEFYAKGKLVSVKLPYKLPGFTYDPKVKNEESLGINLILFFHRKDENSPLEIIR